MVSFTATVKETDLWLLAHEDLTRQTERAILDQRRGLEAYIAQRPEFASSLEPLPPDAMAPPLAKAMLAAGEAAGTGPMAAVAGAIAQAVGQELLKLSPQVVVENGGDLFLAVERELTVGIHAGDSPLSGKLGIKLAPADMPRCLATSSGSVGHSLSLGRADAACIAAADGALADAVATATGNRVQNRADVAAAVEWASQIPGVLGAVVIHQDRMAAWGQMELVET